MNFFILIKFNKYIKSENFADKHVVFATNALLPTHKAHDINANPNLILFLTKNMLAINNLSKMLPICGTILLL